jgi:hypothetical protein
MMSADNEIRAASACDIRLTQRPIQAAPPVATTRPLVADGCWAAPGAHLHRLGNLTEWSRSFPKFKAVPAAATLFAGAHAQAALTVYTSRTAFDAALGATPARSGTDTFDDLVAGAHLGSGPLARSTGGIAYSASAVPEPET